MNKRARLALGAILCAIFGHPRVTTAILGSHTCCRCDAEVGDTASGFEPFVVVNHFSRLSVKRALLLRRRDRWMLHPRALRYIDECHDTGGLPTLIDDLIFRKTGRYGPAARALMAGDYPESVKARGLLQ